MTYPVVRDILTNGAFGFGSRGAVRRVAPKVLICIHITDDLGTAQQQRDYANRVGSMGPSAHDYINRDGSVVHAIDTNHAAWSNGQLNQPKTALALVKTVQTFPARGFNANEAYVREVECVGDGAHPVTAAQLETVAQMIAADAVEFGLAINRTTVGQHSDVDTVNRAHCANLSEAQLTALCGRANAILSPASGGVNQEPAMTTLAVNVQQKYIDVPAGETLYDTDGKTVIGKTVGVTRAVSPGSVKPGATELRLYWQSFSTGVWRLVAAAPSKVYDVPPPADTSPFTQAQVDAAVAAAVAPLSAKIAKAKADLA